MTKKITKALITEVALEHFTINRDTNLLECLRRLKRDGARILLMLFSTIFFEFDDCRG